MAAEERELYPVLRRAIDNGPALMSDAEKEHSEARGLLSELKSLEEGSFAMDAKVATLRGAIAHHVKDEEEEIFPNAERTLGADALNDLGMWEVVGQVLKNTFVKAIPPRLEGGVSLGEAEKQSGVEVKEAHGDEAETRNTAADVVKKRVAEKKRRGEIVLPQDPGATGADSKDGKPTE